MSTPQEINISPDLEEYLQMRGMTTTDLISQYQIETTNQSNFENFEDPPTQPSQKELLEFEKSPEDGRAANHDIRY